MARATTLFPVYLRLAGRRCLVVGAGAIAQTKIRSLLRSGAQVVVVAPSATKGIEKLAQAGKLTWRRQRFAAADVKGAVLVVAATSSPEVNHSVFAACSRNRVWCNAVDDPEYCDFFYPAVVRRGSLQIAISTGGACPALAGRLRRDLEMQFGPEYANFVEHLRQQRRAILKANLSPEAKRARIEQMASREAFDRFAADRTKTKKTG